MSKAKDIERLTQGMDRRTRRYKKTRAWLESRARPGEPKTVTFVHRPDKNYGLPENGEVYLEGGKCPCAVCGHEWHWECEEELCDCCSSICT